MLAELERAGELTDRQREVLRLVQLYRAATQELPSAGWLSRRLRISRQRARDHLVTLRQKRQM
jgi:hypothetical protein